MRRLKPIHSQRLILDRISFRKHISSFSKCLLGQALCEVLDGGWGPSEIGVRSLEQGIFNQGSDPQKRKE
jgi:hypothetical protein